MKRRNFLSLIGLSPLVAFLKGSTAPETASVTCGSIQDAQRATFDEGLFPAMVFDAGKPRLTDAQVSELKERIEALYKGPRDRNEMRFIVLDRVISDVKMLP